MPPVDGEQAPARLQRTVQLGDHRVEGGRVEVVEDLRAHDQVERAGRERLGQLAALERDVGGRALAGAGERGLGDVDRQQLVAVSGEPLGEDPDRAADLERTAVAAPAERGDRRGVLGLLVRAALEVPGVGALGVELVEVARSRGAASRACLQRGPAGLDQHRVEPVLEHEQLEVAPRAVERRAGRERARAARARRLVEDRAPGGRERLAQLDREIAQAGLRLGVGAGGGVLEPAVDRAAGGDDAPGRQRAQVVVGAARGEVGERRVGGGVGDPRPGGGGPDGVAREPRLTAQLARLAQDRERVRRRGSGRGG